MFSPRVPQFPRIRTPYSNKLYSNSETDFSVQYILLKRVFLEVFVKMNYILYFHPSYPCRPPGDVTERCCQKVVKIQNVVHFHKNLQKHSFKQYILNAEIRFAIAI